MTLPAPLTPPDSDLQQLPFMPLQVQRLRDSQFSGFEPDACWYGALLWCISWHQIPAGSLPKDDRQLCKLLHLGRDFATWDRVKKEALYKWIECSDGRLYHPIVATEVHKAWQSRLEQRWRTEIARIKKMNQRNGANEPFPSLEQFLADLKPSHTSQGTFELVPEDIDKRPSGQAIQGKGREGTGKGQGDSNPPTPLKPHTLPENWKPVTLDRKTIAGEIAERVGQDWMRRTFERFENHWRNANGSNSRKRDWQRAWANWVIEQDERDGRNGPGRSIAVGINGSRPDPALALLKRSEAAEREENTSSDWENRGGTWPPLPTFGAS